MAYTIQSLKSDLTGILHGTTLNQITGLDNLIYRAARDVLLDVDPMETKKDSIMASAIYDQVYDYPLPVDVKGNRIIDLYPTGTRTLSDDYAQRTDKDFDLTKGTPIGDQFSIKYNNGIKTIRIDDNNEPQGVILDTLDNVTGWTATSTASNVRINNQNYVSGGASVNFDLAAGGNPSTGYISKTLTSPVDLSTQYNQSSLFFWLYFPTGADIISVELRWGTNSTNYYSRVLTVTQTGTSIQNGWNLFKADWKGATVQGSPTSLISYLYIGVTYNGNAQTAIGADNIISEIGSFYHINYYSKYIFRDANTGAFQETVTDDSNLINLDTETYNLLFYKVGNLAVQQQQGLDASFFDGTFTDTNYKNALARYRALYKTDVQAPSKTYYSKPRAGYSQYLGRRLS
jgi:hypothetical protein